MVLNQSVKDLDISAGQSVRDVEKLLILKTLKEVGGNRTKAAGMLGISIRTLRNKLSEYKQDPDFPTHWESSEYE
jgi:two-component system response regulator FlrC